MIDVRKLSRFDWDSKSMKILDWLLAFASIGAGIWLESPLWIVAGVVAMGFAYYRPMGRIQKAVNAMFIRRT